MLMFLRYWGPVCAYAGAIFYFSSLSHPEEHLPIVSRLSDKALHAAEYAVFGALCFRAFQGTLNVSWKRWSIPLAIVVASFYGVTDEFHQSPAANSPLLLGPNRERPRRIDPRGREIQVAREQMTWAKPC
jgi:hypothetical protein